MVTILDRIVETKRQEIAAAKASRSPIECERLARETGPCRPFLERLRQPGMRIIAEVKKASPSAGIIRPDFDAVAIAKIYERHRADCISVLTDESYFQGRLEYLSAIRLATTIPLLRKDFIVDPYQIFEAKFAGADAVLLIAECLPGPELSDLYRVACEIGLDVLIELHDAVELQRVLDTGCPLVGINNRNLRTFETKLEHTLELLPRIPKGIAVVSESGIKNHSDLVGLERAGVKAVLVGESLMRSEDIGSALDRLRGRSSL